MNYNIFSYFIYGLISCYIIIWVGRLFHKNGRVFILALFQYREELTDTTNNLLLTAYYLLNIGYAIIQFKYWEHLEHADQMMRSIATKTALQLFLLAILHYNNMFILYFLSRNKQNQIQP